jgi:hypothetical protein
MSKMQGAQMSRPARMVGPLHERRMTALLLSSKIHPLKTFETVTVIALR